jgi:hypothetical protein
VHPLKGEEADRAEAERGDRGGAQIHRQSEPSLGRHDAQAERHDAHRQVGEQIESGEHAATVPCRDRAAEQRQAADDKQAVADPGDRRRGEEDRQFLPGDGKGEQAHAGNGGDRSQEHRRPRTKLSCRNPDHGRRDGEKRKRGAVDQGVG